ncbi:MAG: hypothetical protein R3E72_09595 [Steroidobacteraceae bacterium]
MIAGQLIALCMLLLLQQLLPEAALEQWGWRIPCVIGGVLALSAFYIRRRLAETPDFRRLQTNKRRPQSSGTALFRHHPKQAPIVIALTAGGTLAFLCLLDLHAEVPGQYLWLHCRGEG